MALLCVDNLAVSVLNLTLDNPGFRDINIELDTKKSYSLRALSNSKSSTFIIENDSKKFSVILDDNSKTLVSDSVHSDGDIIVHPLSFDPASIAISVEPESSVSIFILPLSLKARLFNFPMACVNFRELLKLKDISWVAKKPNSRIATTSNRRLGKSVCRLLNVLSTHLVILSVPCCSRPLMVL